MKFKAAVVCIVALVFVCFVGSAFGQGTDLGTIRGLVTDSAGGVIVGATVTVTDALTKSERVTETNSQGNYEMFGLNSGTYTVTVVAPGMSKAEIKNVVLKGSDSVAANAVLKISSAQESVVVSMNSAAIDTEDQTISQTIDNQAVIELPRDSRDVYSFLYLNPNVTQADVDGDFKFIGGKATAPVSPSMDNDPTAASSASRRRANLHWKRSAKSIFLPPISVRSTRESPTSALTPSAAARNITARCFTTTKIRAGCMDAG